MQPTHGRLMLASNICGTSHKNPHRTFWGVGPAQKPDVSTRQGRRDNRNRLVHLHRSFTGQAQLSSRMHPGSLSPRQVLCCHHTRPRLCRPRARVGRSLAVAFTFPAVSPGWRWVPPFPLELPLHESCAPPPSVWGWVSAWGGHKAAWGAPPARVAVRSIPCLPLTSPPLANALTHSSLSPT